MAVERRAKVAATARATRHHGLEILGKHSFRRIGPQLRPRVNEQHGIVDRLKAWFNGIAERDVDDDRDAGAGELGSAAQTQTSIIELFADMVHLHSAGDEHHAIIGRDRNNIADDSKNALFTGFAEG